MTGEILGLKRGTVRLVEHDQGWSSVYFSVASEIAEATGICFDKIQHVGSTSVGGLPAKPILDVVLGVDDADAATVAQDLVALGYVDRGVGEGRIGRLLVWEGVHARRFRRS